MASDKITFLTNWLASDCSRIMLVVTDKRCVGTQPHTTRRCTSPKPKDISRMKASKLRCWSPMTLAYVISLAKHLDAAHHKC
jgi:hypothetical protein